jgi:hypothetical protein
MLHATCMHEDSVLGRLGRAWRNITVLGDMNAESGRASHYRLSRLNSLVEFWKKRSDRVGDVIK